MLGLRDKFAGVGSRVSGAIRPDNSFKTYRFSWIGEPEGVMGEFSNRIKYYINRTVYAWAEANRIDDDKYTIRLIFEHRHGDFLLGDNEREIRSVTEGEQSIFSKAEVRAILEDYEKRFQERGRTPDKVQPFRAQHYSNIDAPTVESPTQPKNEPV